MILTGLVESCSLSRPTLSCITGGQPQCQFSTSVSSPGGILPHEPSHPPLASFSDMDGADIAVLIH
jgi:hypothetical protein